MFLMTTTYDFASMAITKESSGPSIVEARGHPVARMRAMAPVFSARTVAPNSTIPE